MRGTFRRLMAQSDGATAVEFALVLPILLFFLFGIIDIGRVFYTVNEAEKATQMGARYAIVTDVIPTGISSADYVGAVACDNSTGGYQACKTGDMITNPNALPVVTCTSTGCTSAAATTITMATGAFTRLVDRMRAFDPAISEDEVSISFRGSGLGFAGDPTGMQLVPLVTVEVANRFRPLAFLSLATFALPSARTTLTAESSTGIQSN